MKSESISNLRKELQHLDKDQMMEVILNIAKYKTENKEFLNYLLFFKSAEQNYITEAKSFIDLQFYTINYTTNRYTTKGLRKVLKLVKKYIKFSSKKETDVELSIFFCKMLVKHVTQYKKVSVINNILERELLRTFRNINALHEDLQFDYKQELAFFEN